jgi:hypothetical protein
MSAALLQFPDRDLADVPARLRALADQIEAGDYDDAHNLAWVIDCGNGRVELGVLGATPVPAAIAHFLFALGQRRLENSGMQPE